MPKTKKTQKGPSDFVGVAKEIGELVAVKNRE